MAREPGFATWCMCKHSLATEMHLEETLDKVTRELGANSPEAQTLTHALSKTRALRKRIAERYGWMSKQELGAESECCEEDVGKLKQTMEELRKRIEKARFRKVEEALAGYPSKISFAEAESVVAELSKRYEMDPPKLELDPSLDVEARYYPKPHVIAFRSELIPKSTLAHEFTHALQRPEILAFEQRIEQEAERVAKLVEPSSSHSKLNSQVSLNREGREMVTWKDVGIVYGGQHIAKGLERGFVEIDRATGREALAPHERPSTWLNIGLGIGLPLLAVLVKVRDPWGLVLVSMGGHMTTKVWDYAEEYLGSPGGGSSPAYTYKPAGGQAFVYKPAGSKPEAEVPIKDY